LGKGHYFFNLIKSVQTIFIVALQFRVEIIMRIKALILENFRAYKNKTVVPISMLTAFVGRNDAGKSTILEALDIFFEGGIIKIESADASKGGNPKEVRIGVIFTDLPPQLILDSNSPTTLATEYLLNVDGDLEIYKVFNCEIASPKASIYAHAVHPTINILQKNQKDLKAIIKDKQLEEQCNQAENPSMRCAIYKTYPDLQRVPQDVPLNDKNAKDIWNALQKYLPIFALFQSDRSSSDQDPEVQNPMKVAIEQALDNLEVELENITEQVRLKAQETAERTLMKLQLMYPDLASTLQPKFEKPSWKKIFKLDLEADDGIPLNKRGSGVRRLVLLSFFQAEAERKRQQDETERTQKRQVIYAIEEPETSQHPDSQEQIIRALRELADAGDQVLFTTHVPGIAALVTLESLRYVHQETTTKNIQVRGGTTEVYKEIADALGVLPEPIPRTEVKVAVLMEGKNDIDAIRSMAMVLTAAGEIQQFDDTAIFWILGGGNTLKDWVERGYIDKLGIPQVIIQDSDKTSAQAPLNSNTAQRLQDMKEHPNITAFLTNKRTMDNYIHPDVIVRILGEQANFPIGIDLDYGEIAKELSKILINLPHQSFTPDDHNGASINGRNKEGCKRLISAYFMRHMTAGEFRERGAYITSDGKDSYEIKEWLDAIAAHL
jgi:energy-coupling factor transporter ATP-binding protein EcfA2